ncbi:MULTISPECIES: MFS transporter [Chromobacterium]|uniref:MFS transporter n=1 Tax=Chromobacterium haemolyticum TaxID=394935 RepID=A0A1W0D178_9NEIS|nr:MULTISPECIES: MFS transporter [Chromobacterium]KMN29710.1 major facilitator transporter [Chromobacterium sp. LK1]OQS40765.1 MFS transporter [Chromobacterium haemolyticum]
MSSTLTPAATAGHTISSSERKVIFASSLGTVFEWYDFFLYGALAAVISKQFFAGVNETTAFIFALMTFAAGFLVRPFGALLFGRLGDMIGRKYTFLATILIMGVSTFLVGLLPGYASIGIAAPILLVLLRMLQGLAIGGEYGGAAIYVAEHAPDHKRGAYTSWIQVTATAGLLLSLLVILACRKLTGPAFDDWGWRLPFLLSLALLAISTWIRLSMHESPAFLKMKAEGKHSKAPLTESFTNWKNLRIVLTALFGINGGQAVTFYCAQFYSLFFLTQILKVDSQIATQLLVVSLLIAAPLFLYFGYLSDRIGRKPVMLTGLLLAALLTFPAFKWLTAYASPDIANAARQAPVVVVADPASCRFQFDPVGKAKLNTSCDQAKALLAKNGVPYQREAAPAGGETQIKVGGQTLTGFDKAALLAALKQAGYPDKADPDKIHYPMVIAVLVLLSLIAAMVYGPLAATMVELFPTRIRYTSMSLPYHIGNGWIGGLFPTVAFSLVVYTGDILYGLWYPVIVYSVSFVVCLLGLKETHRADIHQ